jgi:hypothetical protein
LIEAHELRLQCVSAVATPDYRDDVPCPGFYQIAVEFKGRVFAAGAFWLGDYVRFNPVDKSMVSFR